ncbi:hypothetical protein CGRA01v4_03831 [Colletotrichum graminicola]|nr:hypothetical protein CGRA01v4_03831 [Colletotrichum graminicola]
MWSVHHPNQDSSLTSGRTTYVEANAIYALALFCVRQLCSLRIPSVSFIEGLPLRPPFPVSTTPLDASSWIPRSCLTFCLWKPPPPYEVASSWFDRTGSTSSQTPLM